LRPDLVILDLNLPEISGFQICQELKNKTAIPILVLTSRDQVKDELQVPGVPGEVGPTLDGRQRVTDGLC
ncbi:MAG: response regulator, partial [Collinsella sp.]